VEVGSTMQDATEANGTTSPGTEIPFRAYLSVLGSQRGFILLFCLSAISTSLALTYIVSDKYESATTISYRPQEVTRLKAEDTQAFGAPSPVAPFEVIAQNLTELVKSESILKPVVIELRLDMKVPAPEGAPWYERWYRATKEFVLDYSDKAWDILQYGRVIDEDPVFAATRALRENVTVVDKTAYIFYIVVRDKYPRRAPMIVDAIASRLVDYLREDQRAPGSTKRIQIQGLLESKEKEIARYQSEIEQLLTANEFVSSDLEAQQTEARWSELELTRVRLEGQITETGKRLGDLEDRQKVGPGQLLQPADYKKLESERLFTEIELDGALAKYDHLKKEIADLEARRDRLPAVRNRLDYLQTKLEMTRREAVQLRDSYQEAVVQATRESSEAQILHPAVTPSQPVAPIKIYHVGLAAFLSLFLAIALVYMLTYAEIYVLFPPRPLPASMRAQATS
jgi:uncharacterized protein involved in exopolysaccharide biosynthesis